MRSCLALSLVALVAGVLQVPGAEAQVAPSFGASIPLRCEERTSFNCGGNTEPDVKIDADGNAYVSAQAGVPGGANLWKRPAGQTKFGYLGVYDAFPAGLTEATSLAPGGGDTSVAIAPVRNAAGYFNVYLSSLSLASATVVTTRDGGQTFETNYFSSAPLTVIDRQWIAAEGAETVYQMYRGIADKLLWIQKSTDGGRTWSLPAPMVTDPAVAAVATNPAGGSSRFSNLHRDPVTGNLYLVFVNRATVEQSVGLEEAQRHRAWLARCTPDLTCTNHDVFTHPNPQTRIDAVFPWVGTDAASTVYVGWTTTEGVFVAASTNQGAAFSAPVRVDTAQGANWRTVFPTLVGGSAGRVGVAYLSAVTTTAGVDDEGALWDVYYSLSTDSGATWTQVRASDQPAHQGSICLRGLSCDLPAPAGQPGNRDLAEVVTIDIDADGMPVIAYPGSRRDGGGLGAGFSFLVKQMAGDRLRAGVTVTPTPIEDNPPPPLTFGPLVNTSLHFDSATPAGGAETAVELVRGSGGPFLSTTAPTGPPKAQAASRFGNPGFNGNPLLAYWELEEPVKVQGSPTVDVWLASPNAPSMQNVQVSVELFVDGVPRLGQAVGTAWDPISFPLAVGPVPAKFTIALPAVDLIATESFIVQLGVEAGTVSTQNKPIVVLYGSGTPDFDSTFSAPMAFAV